MSPPGNTGILHIPLANVSCVVRLRGASQSAGLIHYERHPSGPSYPPDGAACMCERKF